MKYSRSGGKVYKFLTKEKATKEMHRKKDVELGFVETYKQQCPSNFNKLDKTNIFDTLELKQCWKTKTITESLKVIKYL